MRLIDLHQGVLRKQTPFFFARFRLVTDPVNRGAPIEIESSLKGHHMKKICVSVVGSGQLHEVNIEPGTTAGDILRGLNLSDYLLSRSPSADFFANAESVYDKIPEGQKLFASTKATVGGEIFDVLVNSFAQHFGGRPAARAVTISSGSARITHSTPIRRLPLPYWQEAGWSKNGNIYQGNYQTRYGAYQGWIEERSPRQISFFILEPPQEVLRSSHGACFQPRNDRWFNVHMSTPPKDVSSGIVAVERLVSDCFRNAR